MTPFTVNNILPTAAAPTLFGAVSANVASPLRFGKTDSSSSLSSALAGAGASPVAIADPKGPGNVAGIASVLMMLSNLLFPANALPVFQQSVVKSAGGDIAVYTPVGAGLHSHSLDFKA